MVISPQTPTSRPSFPQHERLRRGTFGGEGRALKRAQIADDAHPGINISKIPVGGGVAGLMIAVIIVVIGLIGLPPTRCVLGAVVALCAFMALIRPWLAPDS